MTANMFGITLGEILASSTGILTPDVLRMFGFPKVTIAPSHQGSMFISALAVNWCKENGITDFVNNQEDFWFNDHEDAVLFKLRWG